MKSDFSEKLFVGKETESNSQTDSLLTKLEIPQKQPLCKFGLESRMSSSLLKQSARPSESLCVCREVEQ